VDGIVLGIVLRGTVEIDANNGRANLARERGEVLLIPAAWRGRLRCRQDAILYLARVPDA
jgi:hypothetical protein